MICAIVAHIVNSITPSYRINIILTSHKLLIHNLVLYHRIECYTLYCQGVPV